MTDLRDDVHDTPMADGLTHRQWLQRQAARQRAESIREAPARPSNYGQAIRFGDDDTRAAHQRKCVEIRRRMHTHQFEVAPLHTVFLPNGSRLREGAEVTALMFVDAPISCHEILSYFVGAGVVLESLVFDSGPQAA